MSIAGRSKIILLIALVVIGGVAAYFFYFKDMLAPPVPEPEKVAKRMKIEVPASEEEKKAPTAEQEAAPVQPPVIKPVEVKPEVKEKKAPAVPAIKEAAPVKKGAAKKVKEKTIAQYKSASGGKAWAVHVASYVSRGDAETMIKKLKQDNYNAYLTEFDFKGKHWYRIRVGFYASEREAISAGKKISGAYNISGIWTVKPLKKEIMSHLNY